MKDAVLHDKFWAVQFEAARALGGTRSEIARDALLACVNVKHPKARRGVVGALGQFREDTAVAAALEGIVRKGDASYYVEAVAAQALGQTRAPKAFDVLSKVAMAKESQNDVIRAQALSGLTELKDDRALPIAIEWTKIGKSNPVRGAATLALGKLGQINDAAKDKAYDRLVVLLSDEWLRVRLNAIAALAELKLPKSVAELERTRSRDLDGRVIRAAREAIARIREGADKGDEVKKLREDLEKLQEDNRGLKDRLDKLESRGGSAKSAAKKLTPAKPKASAKRRPVRVAAARPR